jgi:Fe-Mn family superoxide dismutase
MSFEIAPLPYALDALAPTLSAETVELHFEKHHKGYLANLRKLTEGTPQADATLVDLICTAKGALFNNAAQVWNHSFYWKCMQPRGGGRPTGALLAALEQGFGSFDVFRARLAAAANAEFGSGWAWLELNAMGELRVTSSDDAENPLQRGSTPLLAIDVWEHAYYLDHRNDRARYVEGFLSHLVSWPFVAESLAEARRLRGRSTKAGAGGGRAPAAGDREPANARADGRASDGG